MKAIPHFQNEVPEMSEHKDFSAAMITLSAVARVYWRMVIMHDVIWTYRLPTAATDGVYIYVNPNFFLGLPNHSQRAFLLGHEVGHIVLRHPQRGKVFRTRGFFRIIDGIKIAFDHRRYNEAADAVINADLIAHGLEVIDGAILDDRFTRDHLVDEAYLELTEELEQEAGEQEGEEEGEGEESDDESGEGGDGEGQGEDEGEGEEEGEGGGGQGGESDPTADESGVSEGSSGGSADDSESSEESSGSSSESDSNSDSDGDPEPTPSDGHDDHLEPKYDGTPEEVEQAEREDEAKIDKSLDKGIEDQEQAIEDGEHQDIGYGGGIGGAVKASETRHSAEISWKEAFADLFHRAGSGGKQSWAKIHRRRYNLYGVISPVTLGTVSQIAFIGDISGSVDREVFMTTLQEMAVAIDEINPTNGTCVLFTNHECVDDNVHDVYSGGELLDLEVPMGGGTYLSTALDWMEEHGVEPDLTIAFTDGYLNDDDVATLVENDVVIVLDRVPYYGTRQMLEKAGARYLVAVEESQAA